MKKGFLVFVVCVLSQISFGQSPPLSFDVLEYDFGTIKEADGPVTHQFNFRNDSKDSIKITNVKASCGCTTPAWTRELVAPGETGFVQAQYNPLNRPGAFRKSLTVSVAGLPSPIRIYITGTVKPRPRSIAEQYPHKDGALRMKSMAVNFGKVRTTNNQAYRYLEVYNDSDTTISFSSFYDAPAFIALKFEPVELKSKERGRIRVAYNAKGKGDLGFFNDQVILRTNEPGAEEKRVNIMATIEEYFPALTPEEAMAAPALKISDQTKDFGTVNQGEKIKIEIAMQNTGKKTLEFRKFDSTCDCLDVQFEGDSISGGETQNLVLNLDTSKLKGRVYNGIYIYSNDPKRPTQMIRLTGQVRLAN